MQSDITSNGEMITCVVTFFLKQVWIDTTMWKINQREHLTVTIYLGKVFLNCNMLYCVICSIIVTFNHWLQTI